MKPRTKIQHEVFNLSKIVLDVVNEIKPWAFKECNEHIGIATKKHFWCIDCGNEYPNELIQDNKAYCPTCGQHLKITKSLKRTFEQSYYVGFAEVLGDYQVIRTFEVISKHKKFEKVDFRIQENVMQFIPTDHSKIQYVARLCNMSSGTPRYGDLEIRIPSYYKEQFYNPYPYKYYPKSMFKSEYTKIGIGTDLEALTFLTATKVLSWNTKAETLLKAKQFDLFGQCNVNSSLVQTHWPSIKIALRNKVIIKDANIWLDYLELLKFFNKDIRSPKYLFPTDLNKAHDKLVEKKKKIDKAQELKLRQKRILEDQKVYAQKIQDFIGLQFSSGNLTINILESIQDFIDEANAHKHCVYSNKYYSKEDSLIFSASYNGQKVETIELKLSKLEIVQSRGLENKSTKYHKQILKLLNNNLHLIEQRQNKLQNTA